jgi:hypothetical protein
MSSRIRNFLPPTAVPVTGTASAAPSTPAAGLPLPITDSVELPLFSATFDDCFADRVPAARPGDEPCRILAGAIAEAHGVILASGPRPFSDDDNRALARALALLDTV